MDNKWVTLKSVVRFLSSEQGVNETGAYFSRFKTNDVLKENNNNLLIHENDTVCMAKSINSQKKNTVQRAAQMWFSQGHWLQTNNLFLHGKLINIISIIFSFVKLHLH